MKTGKIINCEYKNEWTSPQGQTIYYHNIELDNGDKGSIGAKSKNPDKLAVGQELTYTIEGDKIKWVAPIQGKSMGGGKGYTPEPFEHKAAGFAVSYAKDLVIADKVTTDQMLPLADKIYAWLISKKQQ